MIHEEYQGYLLSARYNGYTLVGYISPLEDIDPPLNILRRLHGIDAIRALTEEQRISIGTGDYPWTYRFICDAPGDVIIINGDVVLDMSRWADRRTWTIKGVFDHLKECISTVARDRTV